MHKIKKLLKTVEENRFVRKAIPLIIVFLIAFQIILSSWILFKGDLYYNEDISRDLLLLENITTKQPITLIGPRAMGISGLFHGPLWLYVNLPAYVIGQGNPIVMGIFWMLLYAIYIALVYFVAKRLFDSTVAIMSALLLSSISYQYFFNNTFGALFLFPLFFYTFTKYIQTLKIKLLLISFFLLGLIIQFEMAFGGPIMLVSLVYLLIHLIRKKKLFHLLACGIILIPLSTFFLFDLRHGFMQTHSLLTYMFSHNSSSGSFISPELVTHRIMVIQTSALQFLNHSSDFLNILFYASIGYAVFCCIKNKEIKNANVYFSFFVLFLGYWIVTLAYKGGMWIWYYYEFTPVIVILFCSLYRLVNRSVFLVIFLVFYCMAMLTQFSYFKLNTNGFSANSTYSWQLYQFAAQKLYADAPKEFGYYIYESDLLGYRTRYAIHYFARNYQKQGIENKKMPTTYLMIDSSIGNPWWTKNAVHIDKKPTKKYTINDLYQIEKYNLTQKDIAVPSDPNMIDSLFFR